MLDIASLVSLLKRDPKVVGGPHPDSLMLALASNRRNIARYRRYNPAAIQWSRLDGLFVEAVYVKILDGHSVEESVAFYPQSFDVVTEEFVGRLKADPNLIVDGVFSVDHQASWIGFASETDAPAK